MVSIKVPKDVLNIVFDYAKPITEYITFYNFSDYKKMEINTVKFEDISGFATCYKYNRIILYTSSYNYTLYKSRNPELYEMIFNFMNRYSID